MNKAIQYIVLVLSFLIYSTTGIFTKLASMYPFLSMEYMLYFCCALFVIGLYAIIWQQIIKRIPISTAYMFKGTGVVWAMLICYYIFNETITIRNVIGAIIIIAGITLFAWSDRLEMEGKNE